MSPFTYVFRRLDGTFSGAELEASQREVGRVNARLGKGKGQWVRMLHLTIAELEQHAAALTARRATMSSPAPSGPGDLEGF